MKIVGVNIESVDAGGTRVSITAMFEKNEAIEEGDVGRMLDLINEAVGADKPAVQTDENPHPYKLPEPAPASRRRRHTNPLGDGETGEKPDPTEAAPQGRRRRAAASTTSEASAPKTEDAAEGETSAGSVGRRRRSAASSKATGETEASASSAQAATQSPSEVGRRRRRRTVEDAADEKAEAGDDKITDVDLTRAASNAAAKIGMAPIKKLMEGYEVERVNEIFDAHRKRFLKELAALVKAES